MARIQAMSEVTEIQDASWAGSTKLWASNTGHRDIKIPPLNGNVHVFR